jgi:hypothetical protein
MTMLDSYIFMNIYSYKYITLKKLARKYIPIKLGKKITRYLKTDIS